MKKCRYCKSEIDDKAKICPNCRKKTKQSKALLPSLIISILLVVFIGVIFSLNNESKINEIPINTTISCTKYQKFDVTVSKYMIKPGGTRIDDFTIVPKGEEWVAIIVNVVNKDKDDIQVGINNFNLINSSGQYILPVAITYNVWGVNKYTQSKLAPGGSESGYIVFSNTNEDNSNLTIDFICDRSSFISTDNSRYQISLK